MCRRFVSLFFVFVTPILNVVLPRIEFAYRPDFIKILIHPSKFKNYFAK